MKHVHYLLLKPLRQAEPILIWFACFLSIFCLCLIVDHIVVIVFGGLQVKNIGLWIFFLVIWVFCKSIAKRLGISYVPI